MEENPFNSNEAPLVEVITNSKDRRVKIFYLVIALKASVICIPFLQFWITTFKIFSQVLVD